MNTKSLNDSIQFIDKWIEFNFKDSRIPGLSVAIAHKGKILYDKSFGYANLDTKEELTPDHAFRIASHSKTFTATAIMMLKEQGKLRLDDKVSDHVPWFSSKNDPRIADVTIRHLLNHTSGMIRDGEESDYWALEQPFLDDEFFKEYISTAKLIKNPDELLKYSNFGYSYLGFVIQAVSGLCYREYVSKNIIQKQNLKYTRADLRELKDTKLATGHTSVLFNEPSRTLPDADTEGMTAATGLCSNASDLCKYFSAHLLGNETLLTDASKREMQHPYWTAVMDETSYGFGIMTDPLDDDTWSGHSGGFPGFITKTQFNQEHELVVVVLTNSIGGPTNQISIGIIKNINYFQKHGHGNKSSHDLSRFEGMFFSMWGADMIVKVNNSLVSISPKSGSPFSYATELEYKDENTLTITKANSYASPGEEIVYSFGKDGNVEKIRHAGISAYPYGTYSKKLKSLYT